MLQGSWGGGGGDFGAGGGGGAEGGGVADHLWDRAVPGASGWYAPQDVEHVLRTREVLAGYSVPVRAGFHDATFERVLAAAKAAGCVFHFASDAHRVEEIGWVKRLEKVVRRLGIGRGDVARVWRGMD